MAVLTELTLGELETAESFLARLTAHYGCERVPEFCLDFSIDFRGAITGNEDAIRKLSELTGSHFPTLFFNAIKSRNGGVTIGAEEVASRQARRLEPFGCPECLAEDIAASPNVIPEAAGYFRRDWALGCMLTCSKHRRPLVSIGMRNGDMYNRYDTALMVDGLVERLPGLLADTARRYASDFESYVSMRLAGEKPGGNPLNELGLNDVISLCRALGQNIVRRRSIGAVAVSEADQMFEAFAVAYQALSGGQSALRDVFFDLICNHIKRVPLGPQVLLGQAYNLILSRKREVFAPVAPMIANAIYDVTPYGPGDIPIANVPITFRRWYNPAQAYRIHGVSPKTTIAFGIAMGFAKVVVPPTKNCQGTILIDAEKSKPFFQHGLDFGWKIGLKRMGFTNYGVAAVEMDKLLGPIDNGGAAGKRGVPPVPMNATFELMERLSQNAVLVDDVPSGSKPLRRIAWTVDGMRKVHAAILENKIWVGKRPIKSGKPYLSLLVRNSEIKELLACDSYLTIDQFARAAGLAKDSIYSLMRGGHVTHHLVVDEKSGMTIRVFTHAEAERAKDTFVNLVSLTGGSPRRAGALRLKLQAVGVVPVAEVKNNVGVSHTFRRSEVLPFL